LPSVKTIYAGGIVFQFLDINTIGFANIFLDLRNNPETGEDVLNKLLIISFREKNSF
jgi:hypothetical protein